MDADVDVRARVPADVEAPDRIVWGLTARQVAILAAAAATGYLVFKAVGTLVPLPVVAIMLIPVAGVSVALALGRRDGLPLDAWLLAAIMYRRGPRRAAPAPEGATAAPPWAPAVVAEPPPAVLRLPADAIGDDGVIALDDGTAAALVAATGRWLNSLTGPVQVVVSAQRVDLTSHALRVADTAQSLPHPALADAALDYSD